MIGEQQTQNGTGRVEWPTTADPDRAGPPRGSDLNAIALDRRGASTQHGRQDESAEIGTVEKDELGAVEVGALVHDGQDSLVPSPHLDEAVDDPQPDGW